MSVTGVVNICGQQNKQFVVLVARAKRFEENRSQFLFRFHSFDAYTSQ